MKFDSTFARLLSDFCLDIAKAFFIATFVTPAISGVTSFLDIAFLLTRGIGSAILFIGFSWYLAELEKIL